MARDESLTAQCRLVFPDLSLPEAVLRQPGFFPAGLIAG